MNIPNSYTHLTRELDINRFELVTILSKRAKSIMFGAKPLLEKEKSDYFQTAMYEVLAGKLIPEK